MKSIECKRLMIAPALNQQQSMADNSESKHHNFNLKLPYPVFIAIIRYLFFRVILCPTTMTVFS